MRLRFSVLFIYKGLPLYPNIKGSHLIRAVLLYAGIYGRGQIQTLFTTPKLVFSVKEVKYGMDST